MSHYQPLYCCEHFDTASYCTVSVFVKGLYLTLPPSLVTLLPLTLYCIVPVASYPQCVSVVFATDTH